MSFQPKYLISDSLTSSLSQIERARGFLDAAKLSEEWLDRMRDRALVLEAHHTTHIEGTHLSLRDSDRLLHGEAVQGVDPEDACELLNYRTAFEFVSEYVGEAGPITEGLIREIHKRLVQGVRGDKGAPGEYRRVQNYVVNSSTGETVYTPPAPQDVPNLMNEFADWLKENHVINPVLLAGIAQFQLVHIHPFVDGNGRTARLLSTLCLYRSGYDFRRLFALSEYFDQNRLAYYDAIQSVRLSDMDMSRWLEYFAGGLASQLQDLRTESESSVNHDAILNDPSLSERQRKILGRIVDSGRAGIQDLEEHCPGVSRRTLQRDLKDLQDRGLVIATGATNNLSYRLK